MSCILKVLLLLAAAVCISAALPNESGQRCLCQQTHNSTDRSSLKDIQIYPATIFCDRVEIVVTTSEGLRYCLNSKVKAVREILVNIIKSRRNLRKPSQSS